MVALGISQWPRGKANHLCGVANVKETNAREIRRAGKPDRVLLSSGMDESSKGRGKRGIRNLALHQKVAASVLVQDLCVVINGRHLEFGHRLCLAKENRAHDAEETTANCILDDHAVIVRQRERFRQFPSTSACGCPLRSPPPGRWIVSRDSLRPRLDNHLPEMRRLSHLN